jgi:hypothetical protein
MKARYARALVVPAHPRFAGFAAFAQRDILPWLADKEIERRKVVKRAALVLAGTAAVMAASFWLAFAVFEAHPVVAVIVFGGVPAFLGGGGAWLLLTMFRAEMKGFLLPKIAERLKLDYAGPSPGFPFEAFVRAGMLPRHARHVLEDGIASEEAGVLFEAAEARLQVRRSGKSGSSSYKTIWRGLLFAARAPRPFQGLTLVMPERSFVARLFESQPAEPVALGLGALEDGLEIRSTFPEEARMVLTERVMRRLGELARRLGPERPALALAGERVLLAIRSKKDRFEGGSLFKPLDDPARIEALLLEFGDLFDLAEALGHAFRLERAPAAPPAAEKPPVS